MTRTDPPVLPAGGADRVVVAAQLGRRPHDIGRVARRCPYGFPAVVEDLPYDATGRPFPTLFYCTCPTAVAAVSRLESAGGVRRFTELVASDEAVASSLATAVRATRRRRRLLARRYRLPQRDGGASLRTGVGGVGDVRAVKCLHAHVAHALAVRRAGSAGYLLGELMIAEAGDLWCRDRRCAAFLAEDGAP